MSDEMTELESSEVQARWNETGNPAQVLGCIGCMGDDAPSANWYDRAISAFSRTEPSAKARANRNHTLQTSARTAATQLYNLRTVGGESQESLLDRIAGVYFDHRFGTWASGATLEQVKNDPTFHDVVRLVSPMSSLKAAAKTPAKPDDFIKPTPNSTPTWYWSFEEALAAVRAGLQQQTDAQQKQFAQKLMSMQAENKQTYVPNALVGGWSSLSTPAKAAILAGVGFLGVALLVTFTRSAKRSPKVTRRALPAPIRKALPAPA